MECSISRLKAKVLFVAIVTCSYAGLQAQELEQSNWYFGNAVNAIQFNRSDHTPALVTDQATPFGSGGSAVASDPITANLLFYTDGNLVYDACHGLMPNGAGLNANAAANQPVALSPIPGQQSRRYIFTNTANFDAGGIVSQSVVNLSLFGNAVFPSPALGDVETKNVAIPGLINRSEAMITVPHANGIDFWLLTHEVNTSNYAATLIDAATFGGTFNTITTSGLGLPIVAANFAYHPPSGKVAVSPQGPSTDALVLNFNNTTGAFSFDRFVLNTGLATLTNQSTYDIAWSPNGNFLYLSRHGETGINADVLQYDMQNPSITLASILPALVFRSYGLQFAPDSAIYHLYQSTAGGPFLLGRLTNADSVASQVIYEPSPFGTDDFNGTQFPAFVPAADITITVSFTVAPACQNAPVSFFANVTPAADSLLWDFGDGATGRGVSPIHTFADAQSFNVTLTAFLKGQMQTTSLPVAVNPFPLQIQLVQDTTACRSEFPPPRGSSSPQQFSVTAQVQGGTPASAIWSNGDTGLTLTPDSAGFYFLVVSDGSGCSTYAGVNVREYELQDQRANIWYFGNHAGIDFNPLPNAPIPLDDSAMDAPEGTSTISLPHRLSMAPRPTRYAIPYSTSNPMVDWEP